MVIGDVATDHVARVVLCGDGANIHGHFGGMRGDRGLGMQIAYMKQRRGSGPTKGDKPTGGLGLGAWPNKAKKDADSAKVCLGFHA